MSRKERRISVTTEDTLLPFLLKALQGQSRTSVKALLGNGQISVDGKMTRQFDTPLSPGQTVGINYGGGRKVEFNNPLLKIIWEDDDLIVINKREGLLSVSTDRVKERIPNLKARVYLAEGSEKCWTGDTIAAKRFFPAWALKEDDELVVKALAGLREAGIDAPLSHFSFCTNGSSFCGEAGIPTVGFGPSLESLAHVVDEYIEIDQLTRACRGFEGILRNLCR